MKKARVLLTVLLILLSSCFSCGQSISEKHLAFRIIESNPAVSNGAGLYSIGKSYFFKGDVENNYLSYSDSLWRIISINEYGSLLLIKDEALSEKKAFKDADEYLKEYLAAVSDRYLIETKQYDDSIADLNSISYKSKTDKMIDCLDVATYLNTISEGKTYVSDENICWLLNGNGSSHYVAFDDALALDESENENYIKPVITLVSGIEYVSGNGEKDDPYLVKDNRFNEVSSRSEYVRYEGETEGLLKDLVRVSKASIIMTGDALIHGAVYQAYEKGNGKYDFTRCFEYIKPIVSQYDIAYYNQETVLGGTELGLSGYPQFCSPREVGEAFVDAGFNLVSLATNHTLDGKSRYKTQALENEMAFFSEHENVMTAGVHLSNEEREKIEIGEVNGITYGFLSYTYGTNGISRPSDKEYLVDLYDEDLVRSDVSRYRDKCDVLIVAMHWGEEYNQGTTSKQRDQAQFLADLGVDIIIGCHPHVLEPISMVDDTLCIYSLGNFVSAQIGYVERMTGALVSCNIVKTENHGKVSVSFEDVTAQLIYTSQAKGYQVIPYSELTDSILNNHESHFKSFKKVLTKYWDGVTVK